MNGKRSAYRFMKNLFILYGLIFISIIRGYAETGTDSLAITRNLLRQGKFHEAYHVIKSYSGNHPDDFNATWLHAYTSYFVKHYNESDRLYRKALASGPGNYYLKLDYARMLVNIGYYKQAKPLLQSYLTYEPENGTALTILSRLYYEEANYQSALALLDKIGVNSDEFKHAGSLKQEIKLARAPWISARFGFLTDDQPLQAYLPEISTGWTLHPLATLFFSVQMPVFTNEHDSFTGLWLRAGNRMFFAKPRITFDFKPGLLKFPAKKSFTMTYDLTLRKIFMRSLELGIRAERKPYFSTSGSIDSSIVENHLSLALAVTDMNTWNGNITAEVRNYPFDRNRVISIFGWGFTPPVKFSVFRMWFGLAYSYGTSPQNHFVSEKNLEEILTDYDSTAQIKGIYNPYFTPKDQHVASVLVTMAVHPVKILDFNVNVSLGACSFAMIPYLYLDKDGSGNVFIARGFFRDNYFPARVAASMDLKLAPNIRLQADYEFNSTYYYTSHTAGIGLKINLANGKR